MELDAFVRGAFAGGARDGVFPLHLAGREPDEVGDGLRRLVLVQRDDDVSLGGVQACKQRPFTGHVDRGKLRVGHVWFLLLVLRLAVATLLPARHAGREWLTRGRGPRFRRRWRWPRVRT